MSGSVLIGWCTPLQGRFDASQFGAEVVEVALRLVPATLALWNKVAAKMLPTPAKFHYLFNMRELSKVPPLHFEEFAGLPMKLAACWRVTSSQVVC